MILLIAMVTYRIALKSRNRRTHPLSEEEGSELTPEPPILSPPLIQEEADTPLPYANWKVKDPPEVLPFLADRRYQQGEVLTFREF